MIRWVIHQLDRQSRGLSPNDQAVDKLGPSTVVLGAIIQVQQQFTHVGVTASIFLPPLIESINDEVAGYLGTGKIQIQFLRLWQKDAKRSQLPPRLEVMVGCSGATTTLSTARKRSDQNRCFRIQREPQSLLADSGEIVGLCQVSEDGIGFFNFFWGRLLVTVRRRKPS